MNVAIICDSTACLPDYMIRQFGLIVVPVQLIHCGKVYLDGIDITPSEVYQLLSRDKTLPTTSAPAPGAFLEAFEKLKDRATEVLVITVSRAFSHTYDSARAAAELARDKQLRLRIEVVDCGTAAGAHGLVVLEAARLAAAGMSLDSIMAGIRSPMSQVKLIAFLDTLHFLARGGRVPQVAAWASSVLRIKPLVQIRPGASRASLIARVRTRRRAIEQLLTETGKQVDSRPLHVMVMHSDCAAEAEFVRYCLSQRFNCVEIMVGDFTPVMGIHTGPGLLGVAFYEEAS